MSDAVTTTAESFEPEVSTTREAASKESLRVETLRGLACLFLVAFHVIGSHATSGLHVAEDSPYRRFAILFQHLRMPLFTFLSGFVYAYRPVVQGRWRDFTSKKLSRLLLPLLCVSTLYYLMTMVVPDATGKIPLQQGWRIYFFPYVHFWFLQAIILIFATVVLLEAMQLLATIGRWVGVLVAAMAIHLYVAHQGSENAFFSWVDASYLAPYFLLGLGANRFRELLLRPALIWIVAFCFLGAMAFHSFTVVTHGHVAAPGTVIGLLIGVTGTLTLVYFFPHLRVLELLGAYSFTVYLFHPFFVAGSRAVLKFAHIGSTELGFAVGLAAGVIGPPLLEMALRSMPWPRRYLLGQR
jgi:surface polysaccharide O-acyltransferase-like enzyme